MMMRAPRRAPEPTAKIERPPSHIALKKLVADERRVSCGALEPLWRIRGPGEEVVFMHKSGRCPLHGDSGGFRVLLDSDALSMTGDKASVAA